jgi:RHS repeat-associated protein
LRFPGQYYDQETGLFYNYNRDYDPAVGRYVESDPIGLYGGSYSTYSYAQSDPVVLADPSGLRVD